MNNRKKIPNIIYFSQFVSITIFIIAIISIENQNILNLLIFICSGFLAISFISFARRDIFAPLGLIPITFTLYGIGPLTGEDSIVEQYSLEVLEKYLGLQVLGLVAMLIGMNFACRNIFLLKPNIIQQISNEKKYLFCLQLTAIIMLGLSVISVYTQFMAFGGLIGLLAVGYGGERFQVLESTFTLGGGFDWLFLTGILFWFLGLKTNSKINFIIGIIIYVSATCIVFLIGGRSSFIYSIIFAAIIYHYGYREIPRKVMMMLTLMGFIVVQFYALGRYYLRYGAVDFFISTFDVIIRNPELILPINITEFKAPTSSLLEILQFTAPPMQYGSSYLPTLGAPFPFFARFFAELGFDPSEWRMSTFYPEFQVLGEGRGFSPVTEGYINFGTFGVFLHLSIYGWVIGYIYKKMLKHGNLAALLLFAGSLPIFMLDGIRIHSLSFVYKLTRVYLMPVLVFIISKYIAILISPKRSKTSS